MLTLNASILSTVGFSDIRAIQSHYFCSIETTLALSLGGTRTHGKKSICLLPIGPGYHSFEDEVVEEQFIMYVALLNLIYTLTLTETSLGPWKYQLLHTSVENIL